MLLTTPYKTRGAYRRRRQPLLYGRVVCDRSSGGDPTKKWNDDGRVGEADTALNKKVRNRSGLNGGLFIRTCRAFLAKKKKEILMTHIVMQSLIYNWDPPPIVPTHRLVKRTGIVPERGSCCYYYHQPTTTTYVSRIPTSFGSLFWASWFVMELHWPARDESIIYRVDHQKSGNTLFAYYLLVIENQCFKD